MTQEEFESSVTCYVLHFETSCGNDLVLFKIFMIDLLEQKKMISLTVRPHKFLLDIYKHSYKCTIARGQGWTISRGKRPNWRKTWDKTLKNLTCLHDLKIFLQKMGVCAERAGEEYRWKIPSFSSNNDIIIIRIALTLASKYISSIV